ncbi:spore germination protein KB [Neobacillus sp. B4I6]|uniref:GerAB/ArcD/ProY family transporter n=1 Tax=Neobacillus sp. B4I6 TaxID=3373925 RepID=UPI003D1B31D3
MKINALQIFWLTATFELATTLLFTISPAITEAKQDAWISMLIAGTFSIMITFISIRLSCHFPNQTIIEYSRMILGKWLGRIIVIPLLVHWYLGIAVTLRQSSGLIMLTLFKRTPIVVVIVLMLIPVIYITFVGGIESVGRFSELVGPITYGIFFIIVLFCLNNIDISKMLPIYADSGWKNILKGSIFPLSFLGDSTIVLLLTGFINEPKKGGLGVFWGLFLSTMYLVISILLVILTFGPGLSSKMFFPFYEVVRFISAVEFIQNLEMLLIIFWILCVFVKLSLFLFAASYGTAQWLNMKNWKGTIWFVGPIIFTISLLFHNFDEAALEFPKKVLIPFLFPLNYIGIPVFLLALAAIRRINGRKNE